MSIETSCIDFELSWVESVLSLSELFCLIVTYLLSHAQLLVLDHLIVFLLFLLLAPLHFLHCILIGYFGLFFNFLEVSHLLLFCHVCFVQYVFAWIVMNS